MQQRHQHHQQIHAILIEDSLRMKVLAWFRLQNILHYKDLYEDGQRVDIAYHLYPYFDRWMKVRSYVTHATSVLSQFRALNSRPTILTSINQSIYHTRLTTPHAWMQYEFVSSLCLQAHINRFDFET